LEENEIVIREMTVDDLFQVVRHERELFSDPWPMGVFREDINSQFSHPFVAQMDNEIVGYAVLWVGVDEGHLTNIAVARKYQRKSIAKRLLSHILRLAAEMGLAQIILEVRPSNQPAIALYRAFGFEQLSIRKHYYRRPPEDCLVMRKAIAGKQPA
jgi:ribosomal-protein-alanine N-acetyltransferase